MLPKPKAKPAMVHPTPSNSLTLLLLLFTTSIQGASTSHPSPAGHVPVRAVVYRSVERSATTAAADEPGGGGGGGGGRYEPFQLCMGCRCCAASAASGNASSSCVDTRCCYTIDCNIPGKPFGLCAFSPRTCGCGDDADAGSDGNNCNANR